MQAGGVIFVVNTVFFEGGGGGGGRLHSSTFDHFLRVMGALFKFCIGIRWDFESKGDKVSSSDMARAPTQELVCNGCYIYPRAVNRISLVTHIINNFIYLYTLY